MSPSFFERGYISRGRGGESSPPKFWGGLLIKGGSDRFRFFGGGGLDFWIEGFDRILETNENWGKWSDLVTLCYQILF